MNLRRASSIWAIVTLVLSLSFVAWSVWLIRGVGHQQRRVESDVRLVSRLTSLEQSVRDLRPALDKEKEWPPLYRECQSRMEALRQEDLEFRSLPEHLTRIDFAFREMGNIHRRAMSSPAAPELLHLHSIFDEQADLASADAKATVAAVRQELTVISIALAQKWKYLNLLVGFSCVLALIVALLHFMSQRQILRRERGEAERERLIQELQQAMGQLKMLSGMLPICASCKKIRDEKGHWNHLESYIRDHSEAKFTHGICPECVQKLYGT